MVENRLPMPTILSFPQEIRLMRMGHPAYKPTKPPSCRPRALTRRPDLVHNENCWQHATGRIHGRIHRSMPSARTDDKVCRAGAEFAGAACRPRPPCVAGLSRPNYRSYGEFVTSFSSSNVPSAPRVKTLHAQQRVRPKAISKPHSGKSRKHKVESRNRATQSHPKQPQGHPKAI